MQSRLIIGNQILKLDEIGSTNDFLLEYSKQNKKVIEGLVIVADNQTFGKGQRGNVWESKKGENLTFSLFLKPEIKATNQFQLSKLISVAIIDFLDYKAVNDTKIKWPNDILVGKKKIAGILIENTIRENVLAESVVGIGLNVNQSDFNESVKNATSLKKELCNSTEFNLKSILDELLIFIDKRYLQFKKGNDTNINQLYLDRMYGYQKSMNLNLKNELITGEILGVANSGKLLLKISGKEIEVDLKQIEFVL